MKRFVFAVAVLSLISTALIGCRASGEIGDSAAVTAPR
jgi:hypothetical protein